MSDNLLQIFLLAPVILFAARTVVPLAIRNITYRWMLLPIALDVTVILCCIPTLLSELFDHYFKGKPLKVNESLVYLYLFIYLLGVISSNTRTYSNKRTLSHTLAPSLLLIGSMYYWRSMFELKHFIVPYIVYTGISNSVMKLVASPFQSYDLVRRFIQLMKVAEIVGFVVGFGYFYYYHMPQEEIYVTKERVFVFVLVPGLYLGQFKGDFYLLDRSVPAMIEIPKITYIPPSYFWKAHRQAIEGMSVLQLEDKHSDSDSEEEKEEEGSREERLPSLD